MIDTDTGTSSTRNALTNLRRPTALLAIAASVTLLGGCSLVDTGVSLEEARALPDSNPTNASATTQPVADAGPAPSPADVMFQSTEGAPVPRASVVNVFGEVDGKAASPFSSGGNSAALQQHTFVDEGYDADPCVSRDGKWLVYASTRHSERADIYVQRVDGLAVTQLTADDADDAYPHFSRDGTQITFASNRAGNWDVYVMDADGNHVRQVTHSTAQEIHPTFNPDGTQIVFSALGTRSGQWELWTVDLRNDERRMIGYGLFPDWSPRADKDVIAFQRARQRGTRWFSAWTLDLVDGEARDVTEIAYSGTNAIVGPTWSADGKRLAFCTIADPADSKSERAKAKQDIWTINADGTDRVKLTDGHSSNAMATWARDGRIYFVSDRAGTDCIWSASAPTPRVVTAVAPIDDLEVPVAITTPAVAPVTPLTPFAAKPIVEETPVVAEAPAATPPPDVEEAVREAKIATAKKPAVHEESDVETPVVKPVEVTVAETHAAEPAEAATPAKPEQHGEEHAASEHGEEPAKPEHGAEAEHKPATGHASAHTE